jgi:DNA-directed RNA polymerase specialized sigma24 family protein
LALSFLLGGIEYMNIYSKAARRYLKECTREEFELAIYNAKLTPFQEEVIRMHILYDKSVVAIAMELNCSEATIKRALQVVYLRFCRYLYATL